MLVQGEAFQYCPRCQVRPPEPCDLPRSELTQPVKHEKTKFANASIRRVRNTGARLIAWHLSGGFDAATNGR